MAVSVWIWCTSIFRMPEMLLFIQRQQQQRQGGGRRTRCIMGMRLASHASHSHHSFSRRESSFEKLIHQLLSLPPPQIRIRDPNQGGRDITEEIMSGGRSGSTPTPPQVSCRELTTIINATINSS